MGLPPEPEEVRAQRNQVLWMEDAVAMLVEANHRFHDIQEYTLAQFIILSRATERRGADKRLEFITDMSASISGLFGGEHLGKHLDSLQAFVNEERKDGVEQK